MLKKKGDAKMKKSILTGFVLFFVMVAVQISIAGDQDFTLVNETGVEINAIYISPAASDDWEEDILGDDVLEDGEELDVTFSANEDVSLWDIMIEDDEENGIQWTEINLLRASRIILKFDSTTGKATALIE